MANLKLPKSISIAGVEIPKGTEVSGTPDELMNFLKQIGQTDVYYFSESKGEYLHVSAMDIHHLRNAMLKIYENFLETVRKENTAHKIVLAINENDPTRNPRLQMLARELMKRVAREVGAI